VKRRVVFTDQARQQASDAHEWWMANRAAAPFAFIDELDEAREKLSTAPNSGPRVKRFGDVRQLLLPKTRYHLYYVHHEEKRVVEILSVWSAVRGKKPPVKRR
jgi:plasmid stabilization system protein ParE